MRLRSSLRAIAIGALLTGATHWFVTGANAQGGVLPGSVDAARQPWLEDCTKFRTERDQLQQRLINEDSSHRPTKTLEQIDKDYRESLFRNDWDRVDISYVYGQISYLRMIRGPLIPRTPAEEAGIVRLERRVKELEAGIAARRVSAQQARVAALEQYNSQQDAYEKWKQSLQQQIQAASQAFDDCTKRQAQARNEITPLDDQVMQLLTALILQGSLENWEQDLPAERKKAEERKKEVEREVVRKRTRERIRRVEEEAATETHDPGASAIGAAILESAIDAAIRGGTRRSGGSTGSTPVGGKPSKPGTGGCSGGVCPR